MENLERCPRCFHAPEVTFENKANGYEVVLCCPQHGHMAVGDTLEQATKNWNTYVQLLEKVA